MVFGEQFATMISPVWLLLWFASPWATRAKPMQRRMDSLELVKVQFGSTK